MKKVLMLFVLLVSLFMLSACDSGKVEVQGVTDTTIKVGNAAGVTGALATVGVPFNEGIKAVFKEVNDAGGIGGRKIEFVHYDDQGDGDRGHTLIKQLLEEDKVFAIVGHFGTPTVSGTIDLIKDYGAPMVYAATGINALYFESTPMNPIMAVQPIYKTDGRIMTARALTEETYGETGDQKIAAGTKVGVLYTNDDVGASIKAGIEQEAKFFDKANDFLYEQVTAETVSTAVNKLKQQNVGAVILAVNQGPFAYSLAALDDAQLHVPVFTSYVNADITAVDHTDVFNLVEGTWVQKYPVYTNAWVDVFSASGAADAAAYAATITQANLDDATKAAYYVNSFAIAGYIAARIFVEGLERVAANEEELTFATYIAAMEEEAINVPMGGTVDFSDGKRWGIASMSLLKYSYSVTKNEENEDVVTEAFGKVQEIETIEQIQARK